MRSRSIAPVIFLVGAAAVVACGQEDAEDAQPVTTATQPTIVPVTTAPPPTAAPPVDYQRSNPPAQLGQGLLEGTSLDGTAVYVAALDPALSRVGCEGQREPVLFRVPIAGGNREALGNPGEPVRGTVVRGAPGRVALIAGCEEFLTAILVATETPDGHLRDVKALDLGEARQGLTGVSWSADGRSLLAGRRNPTGAGPPNGVVRIDPVSGAVTSVFGTDVGVTQVDQLADGTYVVAAGGRVTLRSQSGAVRATFEGNGFTVAPDLRRLVVWGTALLLVTPGEATQITLARAQGSDPLGPAQFSPDGRAVAFATSVSTDGSVAVVLLQGGQEIKGATVSTSPGRYVRPFFTGDGRALAFSRLAARPADEPALLVARFG